MNEPDCTYCSECLCKAEGISKCTDDHKSSVTWLPSTTESSTNFSCSQWYYMATPNDGKCDELLNTEECGYDGGDCCSSNSSCSCYSDEFCKCHLSGKVECNNGCNTENEWLFYGNENEGTPANGICEDASNIEKCDFDGGDCCDPKSACGCTDCQCHQSLKTECNNGCNLDVQGDYYDYNYFYGMMSPFKKAEQGNGICEDVANTEVCGYDGGDCCDDEAVCECQDCLCHETGQIECKKTCHYSSHNSDDTDYLSWYDDTDYWSWYGGPSIENGICEDGPNTEECSFDGGDCCDPDSSCDCEDCICHTTNKVECNNGCKYSGWGGSSYDYYSEPGPDNGFCEDESNTEVCGYDGGDCCDEEAECNCDDCLCKDTGLKVCKEYTCASSSWRGNNDLVKVRK